MTKNPQKRDRKKKQIYFGELAKPGPKRIRWSVKSLLSNKPFWQISPEQIENRVAAEIFPDVDNLILLLDHYGIDRDDENQWFFLAFELAREHVPAFQNPPAKGRPRKTIDKLALYRAVQMKKSEKEGMSASWAIGEVKRKMYPGVPKKTVADWYYDAVAIVEASSIDAKERDELIAQGLWHPDMG